MAHIMLIAAEIQERLKGDDACDLEFLAQLFENNDISDTGGGNEVQSRLQTILKASTDGDNNGVTHFAGIFTGCLDRGFRDEFQDPWPTSRNQVGHFITAVDMGFRPAQTYALGQAKVPDFLKAQMDTSVARMEAVCVCLIIGHEQVTDDTLASNLYQAIKGIALPRAVVRQFFRALETVKQSPDRDVGTSRAALAGITIGTGVGNSIQDLHLSLYGFKLGKMIRQELVTCRDDVALWIRTDLGEADPQKQ